MPVDRRKKVFPYFIFSSLLAQSWHFIIFCLCFLLSNSPAETSSFFCPIECFCLFSEKNVNCSNRSLRKFTRIPLEVEILSFHNNKIAGNRLHYELFNHLAQLRFLDLSDNRLKSVNLTFHSDFRLETIFFDRCMLNTVPSLNAAANISRLSLSHNVIGNISKKLDLWPNLHYLDLSFNKIRTLYNFTFSQLHNLRQLNLCKNKINNIQPEAFAGLQSLERLLLCRNKIKDLKSFTYLSAKDKPCSGVFRHLEHLDLSQNFISKVDGLPFRGMCNLKTLLLSRNNILSIGDGAFYNMHSLQSLYLDNNKVPSVFQTWLFDLESLEILHLANNNISKIDASAWKFSPKIKYLNVSSNQLRRLQDGLFQLIPSLTELDLSSNSISVIERETFNNLANLQLLNLSHNHISTTIEDLSKVFKSLKSLSTLHLNSNWIHALNPSIFEGLQQLTEINLMANNITSIANRTFSAMSKLKELHINSSSLLCDCKLFEFTQWLEAKHNSSWTINATCFHPPKFKGKWLLDLRLDQLVCGEHPVPSLLHQPNDMMKHKRDNVTLECSASAPLPNNGDAMANINMSVIWRRGKNKRVIGENKRTRIRNLQRIEGAHVFFTSLLLLDDVQYYDDDWYSCVIKNVFGPALSKPAWLRVVSLPRIIQHPVNQTVKYRSEVIIDCQATGHPLPEISWERADGEKFAAADDHRLVLNEQASMMTANHENSPTDATKVVVPLHINPVKAVDAGRYKCTAKSSVGAESSHVTINVLYPPIIEDVSEMLEVIGGENAVLKCRFKAYPPPQVHWFFNNDTLKHTSRHFLAADKQLLVIVGARPSDEGVYVCSVSNDLGTRKKILNLMLQEDAHNLTGDENFWESFWDAPWVVMVVALCFLATCFIWLMFFCCLRRHSDDSRLRKIDFAAINEPPERVCHPSGLYELGKSIECLRIATISHHHHADQPNELNSEKYESPSYHHTMPKLCPPLRHSRLDVTLQTTISCDALSERVHCHTLSRLPPRTAASGRSFHLPAHRATRAGQLPNDSRLKRRVQRRRESSTEDDRSSSELVTSSSSSDEERQLSDAPLSLHSRTHEPP